eukprot:2299149-Prymnesium_polylepis.1
MTGGHGKGMVAAFAPGLRRDCGVATAALGCGGACGGASRACRCVRRCFAAAVVCGDGAWRRCACSGALAAASSRRFARARARTSSRRIAT